MAVDQSLIDRLPAPLLEEFRAGRWLPIVGAGLSMGARNCGTGGMPNWERLGKVIGADLPKAYSQGGAVEAISAYEHAYGRMRLTSRVIRALHVGQARPSAAQQAFAALSFEHVVTTNVEQLLEDAYREVRGPVFTVVEDGQLRMANPYDSPTLVKLHGDVHNPSTLILSENDYDNVHLSRPLMFTWLAGQLITKTGILIGYSLGDPDVRAVLASLRNGLGSTPPDLWVLTIGDDPVIEDRYRRRGVRVASLPQTAAGWGILRELFDGLLEYSQQSVSENISGTTSVVDAAVKAGRTVDAFVLFLVHPDRLPLYAEFVFPHIVAAGLLPVSRADVRATQGFSVAAIDNLLRVAGSVVVEGAGPDDASVVRAYTAVGEQRTFVIGTGPTPRTPEVGLQPPDNDLDADAWGAFGEALVARLRARRKALGSPDASENVPEDLRTRTLIALIDLEAALRGLQAEGGRPADSRGQRFQPLRRLLSEAIEEGILPQLDFEEADEIVAVRNALVHGARDAVPEHRLPHVLDRAVGLLQQIQPYLLGQTGAESGQDLEPILARYESEAPEWPHRNLSQQLLELGYLPNTVASPPRSYIRWLYAGHRGRVSLHQVEDGLLLDSRVHKAFAARLPGADVRGRRVFFVYQRLTLEQIVSAAERLRRQVAD